MLEVAHFGNELLDLRNSAGDFQKLNYIVAYIVLVNLLFLLNTDLMHLFHELILTS
jgi:hypothetical protein